MSGLPPWASRGSLTGLMFGLPTVLGVMLAIAFPRLQAGWTVLLLPLLVAGPVATLGLRPAQAVPSMVIAGLLSAGLASAGLCAAAFLLPTVGPASWAPIVPAAMSSAPLLVRAFALPLSFLSASPLEILVYQPVLAALLGGLSLLPRVIMGRFQAEANQSESVVLGPFAVRTQLLLASGFLLVSLLAVSWIGFSAIQESRARGQVRPVFAQ